MGRTLSAFVLTTSLVLASVTGTHAATLSWTSSVDAADVQFHDAANGMITIHVKDCNYTNHLDYPALPFRIVTVMLPQGERVSSFRVEGGESLVLDESAPLEPFRGDYLDDGTRRGLIVARDDVVDGDGYYPSERVRFMGSSIIHGYRLAAFAVYPFRYNIESGRLELTPRQSLVVETEAAPPELDRLERMRFVDGFRDETRRTAQSRVVNPEMANLYSFDDIAVDDGNRAFLPSDLPSMEGSEVAYLIITNEEMAPAFEVLAEWKTRKGVPAVVRTIEWIQQNYRSGADLAESIRIFIQEAYAKWGVSWVVLGGDTDIIPERLAYVSFYTGEFIPTDMYYSCLDGTWNADGDSLWGEAYQDIYVQGDEVDLYAEVYLGRMPASTFEQAELLVGKVTRYAEPADTATKRKFLMLAEVIFPSNYTSGDPIILDGAEIAQPIYDDYLNGNPDVDCARMFETYDLYPGSVPLNKDAAVDSLNAGTNHVLHVGHGYKYNMSVGVGSILNYDANNLTNGDGLFAMYLMNCTNVAFDTDCLAEYFLLNDTGGAFAVTGASRSAFPSASRPYVDNYYSLLFDQDMTQLGKVFTKSREPYTPGAFGETADRWTHFIYNYLGDPEVSIYLGEARTLAVTHPSTAVFGLSDISIEVTSGGMPYESALVCLYKEGDDYSYQLTNPSGIALFEDYLCRSEGVVWVTVTGLDHGRYADTIQVVAEADAYLRVDKYSIDDNVDGNDDGILDAGETADIFVRLENTGQTEGEKLYAILRSADADVTIPDSVATYGSIAVGTKSWGTDGYRIAVDEAVDDERAIEFTIDVHDSTGGLWSETFALEVHSPEIEIYLSTRSDEPPYGDGNGTIDNGETFLLNIGVKNYGTGTAYGLEGKIRSSDPDVSITDSTSSYTGLATLGLDYGEGFVLIEYNTVEENDITFEVTDHFGRVYSRTIELREPAAPEHIFLDSSYGPNEMHMTWHAPDELDNYRYMVYRSEIQGGPFDLTSADPVLYTLFRDYGLAPSTRYYYVITAVDSSGNESAYSLEMNGTTSPPQQLGWPNKVEKETASSPRICDVDGDTHPDIVIGSDYVYAWSGNGIELRDGDSQPLTWGVFNTQGDNFTASIALADLDGVVGAEIIGASWNTKEIYVFDKDGNNLAGWPKTTTYLCWASPVVGDIDDDDDLEILAFDLSGTLYAWHHDGTEVRDGDSNPGTYGIFYYRPGSSSLGWHVSTPALADMDGDGVVEIIMCSPGDSVYCIEGDGSPVVGWPVPVQDSGANISASPVVGDIDDDGDPEVVIRNSAARVTVYHHDGTVMSGWPRLVYNGSSFFAGSPALGDLNGDGKLEIVVPGNDQKCHIFQYNGSVLPNWPQQYAPEGTTESSPIIADITGDGNLDVILGCEDGYLNAWNADGSLIPGFPIKLNSFVRGTPMVRDLDFDGDIELVAACWDQNVYVWDIDAQRYHGYAEWNGFRGNVFNTGWKDFSGYTGADQLSCAYRIVGGAVELNWSTGGGEGSWNLLRAAEGGAYELIGENLAANVSGIVHYIDRSVEEGVRYSYRLEAYGEEEVFAETSYIEVPVSRARLYQNHPNPFNPSTTIAFTVPGDSNARQGVVLAVYDVRGALVRTLVNEPMQGGRHEMTWDGRNNGGKSVATGVYFARLSVGGFTATKKMILLR